eukprot:12331169-Ditylum_brightwellii.AAC.1
MLCTIHRCLRASQVPSRYTNPDFFLFEDGTGLALTYNLKAASVLSANLGGPSKIWLKTLDACEQKDCTLDCDKDGEKVIERTVADTEHRSVEGVLGPFALAVDATKLNSVTESSAGCMVITGVEHPNELIDIKG